MQFDPSHNSDIINYYYTNYSTCPKNPSYFSTWKFLSLFCHALLIIQTPLIIFTGYCILTKTPKAMGSLKWAMLNLHFWTTFVDILLCTLSTPYLFFPTLSGFSIGLLSAIGVPTTVQLYLGIVSIAFLANSITALFENRSSSFQMNRFRFERASTRFAFFFLTAVVFAVIPLPLFFILPEQNSSKFRILVKLKCPTEEFFEFPVFVLLMSGNLGFLFNLGLAIHWCLTFLPVLFFIFCTTHQIFYSKTGSYSESTKRLQKIFFIGNLIQIAIPALTWAIPTCVLYIFFWFNYHSQAYNNIFVAIVCLHGLASNIAVLTIHHPYRTYIRKLVGVVDVVSAPNSLILTK